MPDGIHLTLLIGPGVPVPAPAAVVDALTGVQVNHDKERSGFQLTFAAGKNSPLLTTLLPTGYFDPMLARVILVVTLNGMPNVIMNGIVTRQDVAPSNEPGQSTITITGEDLSVLMDVIERVRPYPAVPDVGKVYLALAPYAAFGIVPLVIPPIMSIVDIPTNHIETQTMTTDRAYIRGLAQRCGYIFAVEPGPVPGTSVAYFGPDVNLPVPQAALTINMDAHTNVESLSFSLDGLAKSVRIYTVYDPFTHKIPIQIPVPNINVFKPPLGARPTPPAKVEFAKDVAQLHPDQAARGILGFLMNNAHAISANGSLDVLRYGHLLRARMLVGVRGASPAYDGLYYVNSVTHNIKRGEYKQNFTLSRDGLISPTPVIPAGMIV
jgi:hypothetical protein